MYKKHVVAFLDILGFKSAIEDKKVDIQNIWNVLKSFKISESSQQVSHGVDSVTITPNVIAFSDNIAITVCPSDLDVSEAQALRAILNHIHQIISCSIKNGLLVRGAITTGDLYLEERMIFGPALIEAVNLEKNATHPRVIFSQECLRLLEVMHEKSTVCKYTDNSIAYFDHLGIICKHNLSDGEDVFHALNATIRREESNEIIENKITWLKQYYHQAKNEWERIKQQC